MKTEKYVGQKWRLKCGLLYGGFTGPFAKLVAVGPDDAMIFDSRDNRELKRKFYSAILKMNFEVEEIS